MMDCVEVLGGEKGLRGGGGGRRVGDSRLGDWGMGWGLRFGSAVEGGGSGIGIGMGGDWGGWGN